jgi:hypothetical protein
VDQTDAEKRADLFRVHLLRRRGLMTQVAPLQLVRNGSNRRFQFDKRSQLFIRTHNKMLPVISRNSGYRHMSHRVEKHGIVVLPG